MKINRLLEITTILLNKKTATATELAERFGVSTRTIYRDIDVLSASGVPVFCTQGATGGISILEDYTINRTSLSNNERDNILFALQSLQATRYPEIDSILEKLGAIFKNSNTDWISVDFSPWGSNPNEYHKFTDIKTAILQSKVIEIDYVNTYNEKSSRKIEPLRLIFKSQAWYLWGFCLLKNDYRMFRISRIKRVDISNKTFDRNIVHEVSEEKPISRHKDMVHLVLEFSEETKYRLYDDFDDEQLKLNENGKYILEYDFPEDEWVYGYILSFGSFVKVLEPVHIANLIKQRARKIVEFYK